MTVSPSHVYLYAATPTDLLKAQAAANVCGVPRANCTGNFQNAWRLVAAEGNIVVAVGGAAVYSLYYNPCGWANPSGQPGGHTPFEMYALGQGVASAKANYFANAGGVTSLDSLTLAVMLTYYAIHGVFPRGYGALPTQETPQQVCVSNAQPNVTSTDPTPSTQPAPTTSSPSVGVYASISTTSDVQKAISQGWPGIAVTTALGAQTSPFTATLSAKPDAKVAQVLESSGAKLWWLSFWTVSWPTSGTTFYQAGFDAGSYAGTQIQAYPGTRRPNYVILDPEGYNTPAQTAQQFQDFIRGWDAGLKSINTSFQPAFYCNQSQYTTFQLSALSLPAFVAIAPITGNRPQVTGGNIKGYIAYYATCPVNDEITQVKGWGALYNTVQFRDSGIDCGPTA
ncbi:hypothetical protein [Alicyclobacillus acidoterrestris]|uniref:Uncharacterized protein n=1 Tax=Alicyclobacillus acidoterrestris (strain ATCC 49025 / DSM 3922 / CIP 106132 / NCIMB 13137 / GD3B) TaxID=1356854 RepID=A0A9E6ZGR9_ALIAG|nr:hypothetical protein [Alicyclobacillus acidoterrestris]UNO50337.1 hypothetical protein K1I37_07640 [Alicyclobacillus acidoterrestris]